MIKINRNNFKSYVLGIIILIFASYLFFNIVNYVHEMGHHNAFSQEGIDSNVSLNLGLKGSGGLITFSSKEDCNVFNSLPKERRDKIIFAGIKYGLILAGILLITFLILPSRKKRKRIIG